MTNLKPSNFNNLNYTLNHANKAQIYLDYSIMKICSKLAKLGIDGKEFFMKIDKDKSGSLTFEEFRDGIMRVYGIYFSSFEAEQLHKLLDDD